MSGLDNAATIHATHHSVSSTCPTIHAMSFNQQYLSHNSHHDIDSVAPSHNSHQVIHSAVPSHNSHVIRLAAPSYNSCYIIQLAVPVPRSPLAENLTPSLVHEMTTESPIWLRSRQILWNSDDGSFTTALYSVSCTDNMDDTICLRVRLLNIHHPVDIVL